MDFEEKNSSANKTMRRFYAALAAVVIFFGGYQYGLHVARAGAPAGVLQFLNIGRSQAPKTADWNLLWDAIDKVNERYVDKPADPLKVLYGAVAGAVDALGDPYSVFLPPKEAKDFGDELRGNFEGIGAEIAIKNQRLTVVSPLDGSPAQKAGVRAGDYIYKVEGQETRGLTLEEVVAKIRGPAGTKVKLTVVRKADDKPLDFTITRAHIEVKSVSYEIREAGGRQIGVLKLKRFGDDTTAGVDAALNQFLLKNVKGIVVDVRNNPGGYLETAVQVASNWLPEGQTVVIQRSGDGQDQVYKAEGKAKVHGIPTVVLVNGGSASASEILAGALRDNGIAKLVGEKSFGKGSVQELIELQSGAELKLTIAKWLTPSGHNLNKDGLDPDYKVELSDSDFQANRDPQLDKALDLLAP